MRLEKNKRKRSRL